MLTRFLSTGAVISCLAGFQGCATAARDRDFDSAVGQFGSAYLRSTFTPMLSLFFEREGRWPRSWDELGVTDRVERDPRLKAFLMGLTFSVLPDGGLEVIGSFDQRVPIRFAVPIPRSHKEPNKAPEPTPGSVTPRAGARVAPVPVVAHL